MLEGENWWGLGSNFGRQMPFTTRSDFQCDLRISNYFNQTQSILVSDKGRVLYSDAPVEATIGLGLIRFVSDRGEIFFVENAGKTLAEAFRFAAKTYFKPTGELPDLLYFAAPQLNTWVELTYHQNEKEILAYAQSMVDHGLPSGIFMIDDTWQMGYGTWEFDPRRFTDPKGMIKKLHGMGFKVLLWVCPYVSMDSPTFRLLEFGRSPETIKPQPKGGLLTEKNSENAAVVKWWNGSSALLDFSHPQGRKWFETQLDRLMADYGVDAFKLDNGGIWDYLDSKPYDASLDPAGETALYSELALRYPGSECRNVFGLAGKPLIVRLHDKMHDWKSVSRLVPDMLAAGISGYPFVCPDMVGGGDWTAFLPDAPFDPELFIRSAQIHALSPMMQISASPWRVLDDTHQRAFLKAVALRKKYAPFFVELAKASAKTGEPMMRSLEYVFPGCGYAAVRDQFMMGDTLLVAPVAEKSLRARKVILPPGRWVDEDGRAYDGPKVVEVEAALDRLPHFVLQK